MLGVGTVTRNYTNTRIMGEFCVKVWKKDANDTPSL